ncbi:MAG TPA: TOBE domain-containing protein, partial [Ramlibacter sp.]
MLETMPQGLTEGGTATLCVRPEDVVLKRPNGVLSGAIGKVAFVREIGAEVELRIKVQDRNILATTTPSHWQELAGADTLDVSFSPNRSTVLMQ